MAEVDKSQRPPRSFLSTCFRVCGPAGADRSPVVAPGMSTPSPASGAACLDGSSGGRALAKQATDVARANPCSMRARHEQRRSSPRRESTVKNRNAQPDCSLPAPRGTIMFPVACHLSDRVRAPKSASQCRTRLRAGACSTGPASIAQPRECTMGPACIAAQGSVRAPTPPHQGTSLAARLRRH